MPLRVLLISAVPNLDPACGDVTYTQALLNNPPAGVEYETYEMALANGNLVKRITLQSLARRSKIMNAGWISEFLIGSVLKATNYLRRWNLLYKELPSFYEVKPGAYDLIHLHVFHASFLNLPCPLIVSAGCPLQYLYRDARKWSNLHMAFADCVEKTLGTVLSVNSNSHTLPQATRLLTYTDDAKNWFTTHKVMPANKIDIVPIFKELPAHTKNERVPKKILFVAKDFESKGGYTLLEAFKIVKRAKPEAELQIVGCEPEIDLSLPDYRNITWSRYVEREQLLRMYSEYDIFAYPTSFDCISYVLLEAMSSGLPIATSDYPSMPEAVDFGRAGKISKVGDPNGLAENLLELLRPETNQAFSAQALNHFQQTYSTQAVGAKLLASYKLCVQESEQKTKSGCAKD